MVSLADVARLARESRDADQALRAAVAAAHGAGASVTDLATAADVTRQTIYRWVARREASPGDGLPGLRRQVKRRREP